MQAAVAKLDPVFKDRRDKDVLTLLDKQLIG